mgnify:CR=1 FL=1
MKHLRVGVLAGLMLLAMLLGMAGVDEERLAAAEPGRPTHFSAYLGLLPGLIDSNGTGPFVGASALVLETHRPQERNKVQAFNDFLVFGMMALGSFSSGQLLAHYGWSMVNMVVFPPVLLGLVVLSYASFVRRRARLQAVGGTADSST